MTSLHKNHTNKGATISYLSIILQERLMAKLYLRNSLKVESDLASFIDVGKILLKRIAPDYLHVKRVR